MGKLTATGRIDREAGAVTRQAIEDLDRRLGLLEGSFASVIQNNNTVLSDLDASAFAVHTGYVRLYSASGSLNTFVRSDGDFRLDQSIAPTWTGVHTWNPGTVQSTPILLDMDSLTAGPAERDSHILQWKATSHDGVDPHTMLWRAWVQVDADSGDSSFRLQTKLDSGSWLDRFAIDNWQTISTGHTWTGGNIFSGDTQLDDVSVLNYTGTGGLSSTFNATDFGGSTYAWTINSIGTSAGGIFNLKRSGTEQLRVTNAGVVAIKAGDTSFHNVATIDYSETFTNKTITSSTNDVMAKRIWDSNAASSVQMVSGSGSASMGKTIRVTAAGTTASWEHDSTISLYGDGSDGDLTVSSNQTLGVELSARDYFFDDLTIDSTKTLYTGGYRVFVKGILTLNGTISAGIGTGANIRPEVGKNASGATAGGTAAAGGALHLGAGGNGGAGSNGVSGSPSGPATGGSAITGEGGAGGAGGLGGGTSGAVGAGGTKTEHKFRMAGQVQIMRGVTITTLLIQGGAGGGGGSGGSGDGSNAGGGGGGGGAGQYVLGLWARIVSGNGTISANGAAGGSGANGVGGNANGGGGGGGGGGGFVYLCYDQITDTPTIQASGGAKGSKGLKFPGGTGADGVDGIAGSPGTVVKICRLTGEIAVS